LIDLDLPIQGSLDDPQFSYSKIVWKAFVNVLGKIVTAPFRLLGKLFGGDSDKLGSITFAPGSADISPEQQEKLNSLTKALEKRPALLLTILPTYDAQADKVALQEQHTRLEVLKEMEVDIKAGERPGPVDVANVKAQIAIDNLLKDRKGEARGIKAIEAVKNAFRKSKPEDVPVYQKKLEALKKTAPVSEQDLIELAKFRGEALQAYLTDQGHLNTNRTSIGELSKISGDGKVVDIKMSLGVAKK
jgi:predicted outer membrane protein